MLANFARPPPYTHPRSEPGHNQLSTILYQTHYEIWNSNFGLLLHVYAYILLRSTVGYSNATFLAVIEGSVDECAGDLVFPDDRINPGGYYSPSTGAYTVPYSGLYQFTGHLRGAATVVNIFIDGVRYYDGVDFLGPYQAVSVTLELTEGQVVTMYANGDCGISGSTSYIYSFFTGHMISAH